MTRNEMLSIIVPVYNVEPYLNKCLNSIGGQTFKDLKAYLIDDGSTDKSAEICDRYAFKDDSYIVIHQPNSGVSTARNRGLDLAFGEWLGFVDSDDYLDIKAYETVMESATENGCDVAIMDFCYVDKDGCVVKEREYPYGEDEVIDNKTAIKKQFDIPLSIRLVMWNKIFKKDVLGKLRYDESLRASEDTLLLHQCLKRSKKSVWVKKPLYFNVQREGSAMHGALKIKDFADSLDVHKQILEDVKQNYPDIFSYALKYYIDTCIWKMRSQKVSTENFSSDEKKFYKHYYSVMKRHILEQTFEILRCKDMALKQKIAYILIGVKG